MQPSLISSFSVHGIQDAFQHWPQGVHCELYCLMQSDLSWLFPEIITQGLVSQWTASSLMAEKSDNIKAIDHCADKIAALAGSKGIQIGSLATYLPEISHCDKKRRDVGILAAKFCVRLALALVNRGHSEIEVIELVLGSRAQGMFPALWDRNGSHPELVVAVNKLRQVEAQQHALESLREIAKLIKELKLNLKIAVEMEPGPLNVLSSSEAVKDFVLGLGDGDDILGLNIDLAHWAIIADLEPTILASTALQQRIFHAHVSDHASGIHFGDLVMREFGLNAAKLRRWIHFISQIQIPPKFISVELEAAKSINDVVDSVHTLAAWLSQRR